MSEPQRLTGEFRMLLDAACEDSLTPAQVERLESILRHDERARRHYEQYLQLNMDLHFTARAQRAEAKARELRQQTRPATPARHAPRIWDRISQLLWLPKVPSYLPIVALMAVLIGVIGRQWMVADNNLPPLEAVAKLTRAVGVEWADQGQALALGESLTAGRRLDLAKGDAEITLDDGVKVTVAGPASLQVDTAMAIKLFSGRLTADVPVSAVGFRVDTPNARVIDKGTIFGVNVSDGGNDEIHVFEGQVDAFLRGGSVHSYDKQLLLLEGQAAKFGHGRSSVYLRGFQTSPLSITKQQFLENQPPLKSAPVRQYVLSQSYLRSSSPGTFRIEEGEIDLRPGRNNTVCVMMDEPALVGGTGQRVEVIVPPLKHTQDGVFLMCSTIAEQPDGKASFGLRLRRDTRGLWIMPVDDAGWRAPLNSKGELPSTIRLLPDPGGVLRLSIERVSATTFRGYCQGVEGNAEPVLIDEVDVPPLASHKSLYVGVQAFCNQVLHNYRFSQLQVAPVAEPSASQVDSE